MGSTSGQRRTHRQNSESYELTQLQLLDSFHFCGLLPLLEPTLDYVREPCLSLYLHRGALREPLDVLQGCYKLVNSVLRSNHLLGGWTMKPILKVFCGLTLIGLAGCSTNSLFPPEVTRDVTRPEFGVLEAKPDVFKGRVIQLAGRIIETEESANGTMLLVQELPVEKAPIYGPTETDKPTPSFVLLYPGKVDQKALWFGNKLIAVVVAQGEKTVAINTIPREKPYVIARCMHIWKTGGYGSYGVDDFPYVSAGYYPLEHQTYCAN